MEKVHYIETSSSAMILFYHHNLNLFFNIYKSCDIYELQGTRSELSENVPWLKRNGTIFLGEPIRIFRFFNF